MSKLNLEQQVERIKFAMGTYLEVSQSDDKSSIIDRFEQLSELNIIDRLRIINWIKKYNSHQRDDSWIRECVALYIFEQMFSSDKSDHKTLWSDVKIGLSIMDSYNKKIKKVNTNFFNEQTGLILFEELIEQQTDENKILEKFKELINIYFKKADKIILKKIKNSTNEVGKIEDISNPYLSGLIIKRSRGSMSKEFNIIKSLYDMSADKDSVLKPVVCFQYKDNYNYLIMREIDAKFNEKSDDVQSLAELIDYINKFEINDQILSKIGLTSKEVLVNFKVKYLKDCLKNLGKIQQTLNSLNLEKEGYNLRDIVEHKISKRLGHEGLVESLEFLIEQIDHQEKCFTHGDYHPGNILVKYNKCIPIDFEYAQFMPLLYDAIFLVEHPGLNLSEDVKEELISYYLEQKGINLDEVWKKNVDYMSLFVSLRWAGISSKWVNLDKEKKYEKDRLMSLERSESIINKMLNYTCNSEHSNLQKLKSCLNELYQ